MDNTEQPTDAQLTRDAERRHGRSIDIARAELRRHLLRAYHHLQMATGALRELSEDHLGDGVFLDGDAGPDISTYLDQAARLVRAAQNTVLVATTPEPPVIPADLHERLYELVRHRLGDPLTQVQTTPGNSVVVQTLHDAIGALEDTPPEVPSGAEQTGQQDPGPGFTELAPALLAIVLRVVGDPR